MSAELEDVPEGTDVKDVGLIDKYRVMKRVPCGVQNCPDKDHMVWTTVQDQVFVLNPNTDPIARDALSYYAAKADDAGYHQLSRDIRSWLHGIRDSIRRAGS